MTNSKSGLLLLVSLIVHLKYIRKVDIIVNYNRHFSSALFITTPAKDIVNKRLEKKNNCSQSRYNYSQFSKEERIESFC